MADGIGRGDHGSEVRDLQKQLVQLGSKKLEVDGDFGERAESAVERIDGARFVQISLES